jgi:hypothetical protein
MLSTVQMPFVRGRKWKKKWVCLRYSRGFAEHCSAPALRYPLASGYAPCKGSEFRPLPIFCPAQTGTPKGQRRRGRLSLLTFFGEAKKVSGCRATPGILSQLEERTVSAATSSLYQPSPRQPPLPKLIKRQPTQHQSTSHHLPPLQILIED